MAFPRTALEHKFARWRGLIAEYVVMLVYLLRGYTILKHRWKIHRFGEIDLIVSRSKTIVFIEVKARKLVTQETILHKQQLRRICSVAELFRKKYPKYECYDARIDLAIVTHLVVPQIFQNAAFL
jgi:putative endonuclease